MKKYSNQPSVIEVYTRVVDKTVEALDKYLKRSKKNGSRFNIPQELKSRWQARLNFLFSTVEGTWLSLLETQSKIKNFSKKIKPNPQILSGENVNIIRHLSDYFSFKINFDEFIFIREKISVFKPWFWHFLISQSANEKIVPLQVGIITIIEDPFLENYHNNFKEEKTYRQRKNIFDKYSALLEQGLNFCSDHFSNNWSLLEKKIKKDITGMSYTAISDSLGSDLEENESQFIEETEEHAQKNFILAFTEKVNRRNTKWKVILKDGILHMNEKDFLFNICKCEFFW